MLRPSRFSQQEQKFRNMEKMRAGLLLVLIAMLSLCSFSLSHGLSRGAQLDSRTGTAVASAPAISAVISRVEGKVEVCLGKEKIWRVVGSGFPLGPSDKVRTGKNSWAEIQVIYESMQRVGARPGPGTRPLKGWIRLEPETQFQLEAISAAMPHVDSGMQEDSGLEGEVAQGGGLKPQMGYREESPFESRVVLRTRLFFGRVYIKILQVLGIASDTPPGFEVITDAATIGVRGTLFSAYVLPSMATGVSVREGLVEVTAMGESVIVGAGQETAIHPGRPPQPPAAMSSNEERMWQGVKRWIDNVKDEVGKIGANAGGNGETAGEDYGKSSGENPEEGLGETLGEGLGETPGENPAENHGENHMKDHGESRGKSK